MSISKSSRHFTIEAYVTFSFSRSILSFLASKQREKSAASSGQTTFAVQCCKIIEAFSQSLGEEQFFSDSFAPMKESEKNNASPRRKGRVNSMKGLIM